MWDSFIVCKTKLIVYIEWCNKVACREVWFFKSDIKTDEIILNQAMCLFISFENSVSHLSFRICSESTNMYYWDIKKGWKRAFDVHGRKIKPRLLMKEIKIEYMNYGWQWLAIPISDFYYC